MKDGKAPRLAVIIPAYNAESYIDRAVESVLSQSLTELRLIVVNDGSTDGTAARLAALAERDGRLLCVDSPNQGPAAARNLALELLDGDAEYVMFMDADDVLLPDAAQYALEGGRGADMVVFGFSILAADGSLRSYCEPEQHLDADTLGSALGRLYKANLLNQVWGKLFRLSLIRDGGLRFPDYRWGEDRLFIFACLERAGTVAVLPDCKYRYMMHPGESLINKFYDKKLQVCLEADESMQELCRHLSVEDGADFRYMFAKSVFSCLTTLFTPGCPLSLREKRDYVRGVVDSEYVRRRCEGDCGGAAVELLCAVLRTRSVPLNMAVFRLVAAAGRLTPGLFMALKHRK